MKKTLLLSLPFLLAACTMDRPVASASVPGPSVEYASVRVQSWGATLRQWKMEADGSVSYEAPPEPVFHASGPITVQVREFKLDPERRAALAAVVARAEKALVLPDECTQYIPDGPYGAFEWVVGGKRNLLRFNASCMEGPNAEKAGAGFAADRIVRDIAEKMPVTSTKTQ